MTKWVKGVWLGEKHSYKDFRLCMIEKTISSPQPKTETIDIPGGDGAIDLTDTLTGDIKYKDRSISITFEILQKRKYWPNIYSELANYLHGQKMKLIFDDDKNFYYLGRLKVNNLESNNRTAQIIVEGEVEAYKYDRFSTLEEWEWDPYNLGNGIIQEQVLLKDLEVDGKLEIEIIGRRKWITPLFDSSTAMQVAFEGMIYNIPAGSSKLLGVVIKEGSNKIKFTGKGNVSVEYRGGSL